MSVWKSAVDLRWAIQEDYLIRDLADHVGIRYDPTVEHGEIGSWRRSLPALLNLLCDARLGHIQVFLEYQLPYCPRRVDALLCGVHPDTGQPSYVLIELKQWERAANLGNGLVRTEYRRHQPLLHPAEQVRRYCRHLVEFIPYLARKPMLVKGMAYLHNAYRTEAWELDDFEFDDFGQLYTADQMGDLVSDLWSLLDADPDTADAARLAASELESAVHAPARTLLKTAADSMAGRDDFVLLDEQQVAYELVLTAVKEADETKTKKVILVIGGPGSGKSAIAVSLLSALARRGRRALHATGSKALTETLRQEVAGGDERAAKVFTYFNEFGGAPENALDVLICDEAHRVRGHPEPPNSRSRRIPGQIDQLIDAAKVPVFLLDEHQVVRPGEIGSRDTIARIARAKGCDVQEVHLDGQFRCGGSSNYDEWVLRLLGLADDGPVVWSDLVKGTDDEYVVDAVESPYTLESWLRRQAENFSGTARMAAGFCWEWSDAVKRNGEYTLAEDVRIGGWRRPWNTKPGAKVAGVPSASLWASDPAGFGQVGCIYTAQGFEYDWSGVIFGGDLVVRDGQWVARREFSRDRPVKRANDVVFDRLVRNTYKVLLTRGMQGVCVYSVDDETNEFLRKYAR
ncbi:hypothetical protein SAMN05421504_1031000 [Amycolatopsis xylanica]|uniref:AAA+ ATPase domain-containing protein n=1 Tax=Amycolatopsis xylanica TaxID=589385 RepID=A0A1H3EVM6_9PSEU|nr:DUF2075 domain-containing protein [Amycolatopsis xylanica]SDX82786.1 hypothetical protein SAMN05421504_1031000 [Amycolatopsis xylanica]